MKLSQRRAVSPIIATLLLIAISVASGIVVYVFTNGLASNLTKSHVGQVTEQLTLAAYSYTTPGTGGTLTMYVQNTGTGSVDLVTTDGASFYQDGISVTPTTQCSSNPLGPGTSCDIVFTVTGSFAPQTAESTVTIKTITADGGIFTFNVVAGSTG